MSKPWEANDDFVMYLNSGDRGNHPLEPGVTTVHLAFRQELEIPLSLLPLIIKTSPTNLNWIIFIEIWLMAG